MKVLILAAGYGTRLYPLIVDTPKALLPIAQRPMLNYSLDKLRHLKDINEVIVVTNDKFFEHFSKWAGEQKTFPAPIRIVNDKTTSPDDRLGSIGDIRFVLSECKIDEDLLVLGGDNLFDYGLDDYLAFAQKKAPHVSMGVYDIENIQEAIQFGVAEINKDGKIVSFEEKPEKPKSSLIAMCFYYLPKETLTFIHDYLVATGKPDKAGDYIHWLVQEKEVYGFQFRGKWYDIGSIEAYHEAQEEFNN
ncbi:MAG: nucleotidyltransferase family protein [Candidatus Omnitrophica bacterium]|nr:nucleotidyltransferase family protein [Candidatus Omnitrophota bacterium]